MVNRTFSLPFNETCPECHKYVNPKRVYCSDTCKLKAKNRRRKIAQKIKYGVTNPCKKKQRQDIAKYITSIKDKCMLCGYNKSKSALHLHHVGEKSFEISEKKKHVGLIRLQNEIEKCVVLCGNCHAEVHDGITEIPEEVYAKEV